MDFIHFILKVLALLFMVIAIIRVYMAVAAYIGESFGFGKAFQYLWEKVKGEK